MPASITRRVLKVFLASPSDVGEERGIADEVIDFVNKFVASKVGWYVELHKWEDVPPGYGHPQGRINPEVDDCNIFVGLLWERWGQATSKHSSGFEEEFERAMERRKKTGEPEVWLIFKKPRTEKLGDPGQQLKRVLKFRDLQMARAAVLFKEIGGPNEWKMLLLILLIGHVLALGASAVQIQPATAAPPATGIVEDAQREASGVAPLPKKRPPEQLLELSALVNSVIASGELEFFPEAAKALTVFDISRLCLVANTWISLRYTASFLDTHELNLLYKQRRRVQPTRAEEFQCFRTVLDDVRDLKPAWFWIGTWIGENFPHTHLFVATSDRSASLRERAIQILKATRARISADELAGLPFGDESDSVRVEAFKYLGLVGGVDQLPFIEETAKAEANPTVLDASREARLRILLRHDAREVFREIVSGSQSVAHDLMLEVERHAGEFSEDLLLKGTDSAMERVRELSIKELSNRSPISRELAESHREDSSVSIREIALQRLVNLFGQTELEKLRNAPSEPDPLLGFGLGQRRKDVDIDRIALNYYRTLSSDKLLEQVRWLSTDGPKAYQALAIEHYETVSELLREDLRTDFERIRGMSIETVKEQGGAEAAEQWARELKDEGLDSYIRSKYAEAALNGIVDRATQSDVDVARKHINSKELGVSSVAVRILAKFGDASDVPLLVRLADEAYGELKELTLSTTIDLSAEPMKEALDMARSNDRARKTAATKWLMGKDSPEVRAFFGVGLYSEDDNERIDAVRYMHTNCSGTELSTVLDEYLQKATYYYDVVTWLDRLVFAPSPLREMFVSDLYRSTLF